MPQSDFSFQVLHLIIELAIHHFVSQGKMCPNTTAVSIKERIKPKDKRHSKDLLKKYNITSKQLVPFYLAYDLPALISRRYFNYSLSAMREVVDGLLKSKT